MFPYLSCGFLSFGLTPLGVELSEEMTYPVDPAAPVALINFLNYLTTAVFILICGAMEQPLPEGLPGIYGTHMGLFLHKTCTVFSGISEFASVATGSQGLEFTRFRINFLA